MCIAAKIFFFYDFDCSSLHFASETADIWKNLVNYNNLYQENIFVKYQILHFFSYHLKNNKKYIKIIYLVNEIAFLYTNRYETILYSVLIY